MAKSKQTRKYPRAKPCQMGHQITQICGDGPTRVKRRVALAARLEVSHGYLQFLQVGEVDNLGKPMVPSDDLAAKFRTVVAELGGIKKAGAALDVGNFAEALTSPATAAQDAPKAAKPTRKAKRPAKAATKRKTAATKGKARKGGRK